MTHATDAAMLDSSSPHIEPPPAVRRRKPALGSDPFALDVPKNRDNGKSNDTIEPDPFWDGLVLLRQPNAVPARRPPDAVSPRHPPLAGRPRAPPKAGDGRPRLGNGSRCPGWQTSNSPIGRVGSIDC